MTWEQALDQLKAGNAVRRPMNVTSPDPIYKVFRPTDEVAPTVCDLVSTNWELVP